MSDRWEHKVEHTSVADIRTHAIHNKEWQAFRLSMKGKSTQEKLAMLRTWRRKHTANGQLSKAAQVQIDNYINALKRGGQLSKEGRIQR